MIKAGKTELVRQKIAIIHPVSMVNCGRRTSNHAGVYGSHNPDTLSMPGEYMNRKEGKLCSMEIDYDKY